MLDDLEQLLRDVTLTAVAFAIAIGWSLYQTAHGVGLFIDGLTAHVPAELGNGVNFSSSSGGGLTWIVGRHIVSLDAFVTGLVELAVVLALAVFVRRRGSQ